MLELKDAQTVVRTIDRLMDDNMLASVYLPAAMNEVTSMFWRDFLSARVSPTRLSSLIEWMDDDDPNWADVSAMYDQIMDGFTMEAKKAGVDRIIFGIHVWDPKSLTEENARYMGERIGRIV